MIKFEKIIEGRADPAQKIWGGRAKVSMAFKFRIGFYQQFTIHSLTRANINENRLNCNRVSQHNRDLYYAGYGKIY